MKNFNLLPWRERQRIVKNRIFLAAIVVSGFVAILLIVFMYYLIVWRMKLEQKKISHLQSEQSKLTIQSQVGHVSETERKSLAQRLALVQLLSLKTMPCVQLWEILPNTIPEGIYLTSIEHSGKQLFLYGNSQTNASISIFLKNLEHEKYKDILTQIKLIEVSSQTKNQILHFKLGLILNYEAS